MKKLLMLIIFFAFVVLLTLASAQTNKIIVLELLIFQNDTVILKSFIITDGVPDKFFPQEINPSYLLKIISFDGQVVFQENLRISFLAYPTSFSENVSDTVINLEKVNLYLKLPFFETAEKIQIYHDSKLIFDFKIPWCNNNGLCEIEKNENYINCFNDCHCGNSICDKFAGESFSNCPQDCPHEEIKTPIYIYLTIIGFIVLIVILLVYKIRLVR
ncbi:MAG: hypothetical protein QXG39_05745 [Candidatus Aenigmatarchaeota archaeon]